MHGKLATEDATHLAHVHGGEKADCRMEKDKVD
jgi:hypothetical protein